MNEILPRRSSSFVLIISFAGFVGAKTFAKTSFKNREEDEALLALQLRFHFAHNFINGSTWNGDDQKTNEIAINQIVQQLQPSDIA